MAEIDKGLPNTRNKEEIPSQEEIQDVAVQEPVEEKGPIEVIPEEDGGVTLDYEPGAINIPGTENHFDNLAELLPDDVLEPIGNEMTQNYMDYKASRKEWEQSYITGLDLLKRQTGLITADKLKNPLGLDLNFYGGGRVLFNSGGIKSGPPPERGPLPQGLLSLKNRVTNI